MSQEIQLVPQPLPLQPAVAPAPPVLVPASVTEMTPLQRVHQALRGRYALAAVLAAIGAACGVAAGLLIPKPSFKSVGIIRMELGVPSLTDNLDRPNPLVAQYLADAVVQLHAERTIRTAMQSKEWRLLRPYPGDMPPDSQVADFSNHLDVRQIIGTPNQIQITYDDSRPDARDVAQTAVKSVLAAYRDLWATLEMGDVNRKYTNISAKKQGLENEVEVTQTLISGIAPQAGGDPVLDQSAITIWQQELSRLKQDKEAAEQLLNMAEHERQLRQSGIQPRTFSAEEIARVDPEMQARLRERMLALVDFQGVAGSLRPSHPVYKQKKGVLDLLDKQIQEAADHFNDTSFIQTQPDGSSPRVVPKDLSTLREMVSRLTEKYKQQSDEINRTRANHAQFILLTEENQRKRAEIDRLRQTLDSLQFQKEMGGQFSAIEEGTVPTRSADRRPVFAALGFLGGGALPVAMLVLIGLANPRYRFSDETSTEVTGLNLLGILPDLPDRLSDPEQASIAAHCVHQIRTMLQISGGGEERRVFAITSPASGDGKTSLTLALGLSYAACGTRTLLIDCDLVGAGLTSRMNVNAAEGVLEAIANRSLPEYVRSTDVADVSILPVGSAQTLHASTLSPAALRRLIDEGKKQFDTILIDTGPVLGSIEASLVCAAADAVVLTVARGQQRPLAEKAIGHLMSIGAKLAGVVFNRAQDTDFDRSISGLSSLRSATSGTGHNGNEGQRYGTLGRAVHSGSRSELNEG